MDNPAFCKMLELGSEPEALEGTIAYLTDHLRRFLKKGTRVLICFPQHTPGGIGGLIGQAVLRCEAVPVFWEEDLRWKTLLRLAFSSRASTIVGPPLIIIGLSKLARANGTPLYIRNVVTTGYPCLDWMTEGIRRGLDCEAWRCYVHGMSTVVGGFSCGCSQGVHLRASEYSAEIVDENGRTLPAGEIGEVILYPNRDPSARYHTRNRARLETGPCPCGCTEPRLVDVRVSRDVDPMLAKLGEELLSWTSILDCHLKKGDYGLEMELVVFPGEKLPMLPSCAKQVIRPWDPEKDAPFWMIPGRKKLKVPEESH